MLVQKNMKLGKLHGKSELDSATFVSSNPNSVPLPTECASVCERRTPKKVPFI